MTQDLLYIFHNLYKTGTKNSVEISIALEEISICLRCFNINTPITSTTKIRRKPTIAQEVIIFRFLETVLIPTAQIAKQ